MVQEDWIVHAQWLYDSDLAKQFIIFCAKYIILLTRQPFPECEKKAICRASIPLNWPRAVIIMRDSASIPAWKRMVKSTTLDQGIYF